MDAGRTIPSAKVYQFAAVRQLRGTMRGASSVGAARDLGRVIAFRAATAPGPDVAGCAGAWYHEAAIVEAGRPGA